MARKPSCFIGFIYALTVAESMLLRDTALRVFIVFYLLYNP